MTTATTFCRLCEVGCGLVAEITDGRVSGLRPDHDHPVSAGFACNKGLLAADVHNDPDRVDRPQQRQPDGTYAEVSWDEALDDIAARLAVILAEHGPTALSLYLGNPTAFNAEAGPVTAAFFMMLGGTRVFTAAAQDCANKYAVSELMWGSAQIHLVADVDRAENILMVGTNPRISKGSFMIGANMVAKLAAVEARGGTVTFIDPRRSEPNVGTTVQLLPDTDAFLLAAMLHEIDRTVGFDAATAARVSDLDVFREFIANFSAERVAPVVGVDAAVITDLAARFASASSSAIHVSTGVNMGRHGAMAYWLAQMLSLLTGNLDRAGGNIVASRGATAMPSMTGVDAASFVDTPWGSYRPTMAGLPGALMIDMIEAVDQPIKAMFAMAGNPALSIGGGERLSNALASLSLLVTVDYYRNATGEMADYVLPAADWFEREDYNYFVQGTQTTPYVQWVPALVEPKGERRTERWIFTELGRRMGLHEVFGAGVDVLGGQHDRALAKFGLSMADLRASETSIVVLPPTEPGGFLPHYTTDRMIDGNPEMLTIARQRAMEMFDEALAAGPSNDLKLITRRTSHTLNSALNNVAKLKTGPGENNPLWIFPGDAARLGIAEGACVRVSNRYGEVQAPARFDSTLRPGVVAMSHGFGNAHVTGLPTAQRYPGVNVNALAPTGPGSFDPVSTMSHLTGIPVNVQPVTALDQP